MSTQVPNGEYPAQVSWIVVICGKRRRYPNQNRRGRL